MNKSIENISIEIGVWVVIMLLMAFPFVWVWNAIMPNIFDGVHTINFWQAFGLMFIANVLNNNTGNTKSSK